ncbi:MAG: HNH endonuclease [Acidobacteria bacterium]|nr:HNH endonuclease [Acidobacteriota bacterium]MCW5970659.1 HNH endonuclease [Blastocatellales bacterium]
MTENDLSADVRRRVAERAADLCEYCRVQGRYSCDPLTIDHIIPRSIGGSNDPDNLALACFGCNQHKSRRTSAVDPLTEASTLLFHPRHQVWAEHFAWNEDYTIIFGLTPTGRATIEALHLNREGLVNLRRVLYAIGEHPPSPRESHRSE